MGAEVVEMRRAGAALVAAAGRAGRTGRLVARRLRGRSLPFSITFILTNRCNFRCAYCNAPQAAAGEMETSDFIRAIDELAGAGMARASFSGGEALLRDDTIEIIGHARRRGMWTSLNSNGWLLADHLERLAPDLDMLMVSLDGPRSVHDAVRGRDGSFDRAIAVLDRARDLGIATAAISVLGPWNLDRVDSIVATARRHGFWAYFQPAYEDCFDHRPGLASGLDAGVLGDVAARLGTLKANGAPVGASSAYLRRLAGGPPFGDCRRCHAGRYFATVMPDGRLVPCHLTSNEADWPDGREIGFARAFERLPPVIAGPGCAIAPYQESDLIFALDGAAIASAVRRMAGAP